MKKFNIVLPIINYSSISLNIDARNEKEAQRIALECLKNWTDQDNCPLSEDDYATGWRLDKNNEIEVWHINQKPNEM